MSKKLKVAAAGTGYFSQFHYEAWSRCPEVEMVGIVDLNIEAAAKVANEFGCKAFSDVAEMLDKVRPDLFDIITPPQTHLPLINLAADRGIDVVCQKPFCGDIETARAASKLASDSDITIAVHENFRFQPWYNQIKQELNSGRLGEVYQATFRLRPGDGQGPEAYLDRQPYFQKMERFLVHETAIHYIDVFRYLLGEVDWVWAELTKLNPVISGEDSCVILMGMAEGSRGLLDGNRLSDHAAANLRRTMGEMTIEGENGVLSLNGDGEITFRKHGATTVENIQYHWNDNGFGGDCVYLLTRHVVDHFTAGGCLMNSAEDYLKNLEIEEAVYASASDGNRKTLNSR